MSIEYDYYALLELFCEEPQILDNDSTMYLFSKKNNEGYCFILFFDVVGSKAFISLSHDSLLTRIYEIQCERVVAIQVYLDRSGSLILKQEHTSSVIQVIFKPNFILSLGEASDP